MRSERETDKIFFEFFPRGEKIIVTKRTRSGLWLEKEARNKNR